MLKRDDGGMETRVKGDERGGRIGWAESEKDKYPKKNDILQFLGEDKRHRSPD
jgi:hypothetical protein